MKSFLTLVGFVICAHTNAEDNKYPLSSNSRVQSDAQILHPHIVTIERLEHLLRRAGEIFLPAIETSTKSNQETLPQANEPYNYYMPIFDYQFDTKLDEKSRKLEKLSPPPITHQTHYDYYVTKPKKSPKKFSAAAKHINVKSNEHYIGDQLHKAIYLQQDEKNRINFDDSFFPVDMKVPIKKMKHKTESETATKDPVRPGQEIYYGDDLMASAVVFVPQLNSGFQTMHDSA